MGFIVFVVAISLLIISEVRSIIVLKNTDDAYEDVGDDYFDDFETL